MDHLERSARIPEVYDDEGALLLDITDDRAALDYISIPAAYIVPAE